MNANIYQECRWCGNCCHADMTTFAHKDDIRRWEQQGRFEILDSLVTNNKVWAGDRIVLSNGSKLRACAFLRWKEDLSFCSIYDTRPKVCREYNPGSSQICPLYHNKNKKELY